MKFSTPKKCPLITKFTYLLLLLVLFNTTVNATTYYVSTSGNNSNNGTSPSTPWQNLNKVQNMANSNSFKPGDNILFKKGDSFTGTIYWSTIYGNNGSSGTATNPITLGTYGTGAKPIFQVPAGSNSATIFSFVGVKYIVVDGFNITDLTFPIADKVNTAPCGIAIQIGSYGEITSNYCTVRNTDISNVGSAVVIVGDFNTIDSTTMTNLKNVKNTPGGDDDYGANGVTITGNDNIITHNYFSGNWAASYDYGWNGGALEMFDACSRNKVLYNTITDCGGVAEFGAYVSSTVSSDNLFAYNKITNSGMLSWCNLSGSYTTNVNNVQYFNNVIIENSESRFSGPNNGAGVNTNPYPSTELFAYNGNPPSTVYNLKNNVFILSTGINVVRSSSVAKTTHNNNIYQLSNGSKTNFTLNSSEINSTATIFTNTSNPDPSLWDFYPASGSPAIGFGQNVGIPLDFAGIAVGAVPNAGVYESNSGNVPGPLKIVATPGTIACNGATTTVVVTATGGTQPYTGTGTFTVTAGAYNYTVKDAKGDSATTSITITQPTLLTLNVAAGTINVYGGTTSITATATGGTAAYTYKLNNGSYQASNIFNNVASGSYTITVKDAKGCTQSKSISITQPAAPPTLTASSTSTSIMCNGSTSTITVSATGGTQPYTGTGTFTVTAGTYNYTVTDAGGQTATTSITVSQPTLLTLNVTAGTINTYGGTTTITANANGGTAAYTYKLNNGSYQASNLFNNVASGSYTITVKDANGCTQSKSINITEPGAPAALNASATAGTISCNGSNTTVTVSATGGTQPYTGTGTFTVTAGTYNYTVTDAGGQTATTSITVSQPTLLT
ncbi:MAG: hypothetical protein JSU03_11350, partial [Bacteroidetes bacterium]|nr:hypothetical protein [Bacteroidota bacterium]